MTLLGWLARQASKDEKEHRRKQQQRQKQQQDHQKQQQQQQHQKQQQQAATAKQHERQAAKAASHAAAGPRPRPPKGPCGTPGQPPAGGATHPLPLAAALVKHRPSWNTVRLSDTSLVQQPWEGRDAVRVRYPAGSGTPSSGLRGGVQLHGAPPCLRGGATDVLLRFDFCAAPGFDWTRGGKLGGGLLVGQGAAAGYRHSSTAASARTTWGPDGEVMLYVYKMEGTQQDTAYATVAKLGAGCGDHLFPGTFKARAGEWSSVVIRVRLNTPGRADGVAGMGLNGSYVDYSKMVWRASAESLITEVMLVTFFGGSWCTPVETFIDFANVAVTAAAAAKRAAAAAAQAGSGQQQQPGHLNRRSTLLASLHASAAVLLADLPANAQQQDPAVLTVGAGRQYATISEALQRAPPGVVVEVAGGRYAERLLISQAVTVRAAPGEAVEVVWQTQAPYEATVEVGPVAGDAVVVLSGLRIRHSSPSIANNYAVRLEGCNAVLADCDISSTSGDGVGIEGGTPQLARCAVHHCARHGVAVFGDLYGGGCSAVLDGCSFQDNKLDGLLVRDGAQPAVTACEINGNGGWGLELRDAGGSFADNTISGNAKGSVAYALLFEEVDTARMVVENKLDRPVHSLGRV